MSRVQRAYRQLLTAEPLSTPGYVEEIGTKAQGLVTHIEWTRSLILTHICAYSDESSEGHGRSTWGYVLKRAGVTFEKGNGILYGGEVYDAELYGAAMALLAALSFRQKGEKIFVLLDNQAAVKALKTGKTSSCLLLTRTFREAAQKANAGVRWVPGHSLISGNEEADAEARAALRKLPTRDSTPSFTTLAYLRRLMHQRRQKLLDE